MQINELARAKINLCLHVTGQRDDGYHLLDSIVVFADIGDRISVLPDTGFSLKIKGPFAQRLGSGDDNLVLRAAKLFRHVCDGAAITLTKNLPIGSGIGGGSADAAATLRAMVRMTRKALPTDMGLSLGADVPVCVQNITCRMGGIGELLTPIPQFPKYAAVLVCPKSGHKTPSVFSALECKDNGPVPALPVLSKITAFLARQRNDLAIPSIKLLPEIGRSLDVLVQNGATLARMSGSGATCFGLFETDQAAQDVAHFIATKHPNWWVKPCVLGG